MNPLAMPKIQSLIDQAIRAHPNDDGCPQQSRQRPAGLDVHLDIAMRIVNTIYNDVNFSQASFDDI